MKKTLVALSLVVASQSLLAYTGDNDPKYIVPNGTHKLKNMPLNAELSADKTPWASSFFPHVYGGIAFRWNNFYKGVPSFATLHYQVDDINAEIEDVPAGEFKDSGTNVATKQITYKKRNMLSFSEFCQSGAVKEAA